MTAWKKKNVCAWAFNVFEAYEFSFLLGESFLSGEKRDAHQVLHGSFSRLLFLGPGLLISDGVLITNVLCAVHSQVWSGSGAIRLEISRVSWIRKLDPSAPQCSRFHTKRQPQETLALVQGREENIGPDTLNSVLLLQNNACLLGW